MKTILAPVDFSDAAANALSFAAELARRAAARLVVTTVLDDGEDEGEAKTKLQAIEVGLKNTFGDSLACTTTLAHGSMVEALQKTIAGQQTDLLVMGTKGASGLKKMLIGSNTVNVIAGTRVPVLVIPEVARFENFLKKEKNNIVLATDLDSLENDSVLQTLKQIALLIINPTVKVLSVRPKNTVLSDEKRWERDFLLSVFDPEIESERITIFSSNVIDGINYYLNRNKDTGLVAMVARNSGNLFRKHYTREMASHTHLPLLVLHDAEN